MIQSTLCSRNFPGRSFEEIMNDEGQHWRRAPPGANHGIGSCSRIWEATEVLLGSFGAVNVAVNRYRPDVVLPRHDHAGACLSLVCDGHYVERIGRRSWLCGPLSLHYKPPDLNHSNHIGGRGLQALFLEIPRDTALALMRELPGLSEARSAYSSATKALARRVSKLVAQHARTPFTVSDDFVHACLLAVLGEGSRRPGRDRGPWLTHVREFLRANCRRSLTLTQVAAIAGVHPVHLAQTFRRTFGCTFRDYLRSLRLDAALVDLKDETKTIGAIGLGAGFADHAHFSRTFRARFGQTPVEYRRSLA